MSRLFCLIALMFVGLAGSASAADEPDVTPTVDFDAILRRPVKVEFVDTPLSDVVDFFANKFDINIVLDSKGLTDAAVDSSAPVTISLRKPISFEAALHLVLESFDMTFVAQDEVLKITSKEKADETLTTKVYDVADLLDRGRLTGGALADAIVFAASPDSWDDNGGPGQISRVASTLVISQGRAVHAEVKELLGQLCAELNKGSSATASKKSEMETVVYKVHDVTSGELVQMITEVVAPASWGNGGAAVSAVTIQQPTHFGTGDVRSSVAVAVRQSESIQKEVDELLRSVVRVQNPRALRWAWPQPANKAIGAPSPISPIGDGNRPSTP